MMLRLLLEKAVEFKPNDGELRMKYATILKKKTKICQNHGAS